MCNNVHNSHKSKHYFKQATNIFYLNIYSISARYNLALPKGAITQTDQQGGDDVCETIDSHLNHLCSQVYLKSDDLCLMKGEHTSPKLTLPSAHILAMHIQQLEIGAFTLTNGAYKWTKLR